MRHAYRLLLFVLLSSSAAAGDLLVDASGGGSYTTIGAAMADAVPGDRILVSPGHYPAFSFRVAVSLIGLGAAPADVHIDRIDYHVSVPALNYDTVISNVAVGGPDPSFSLAIVGNELPPGTLIIDGADVEGAVYLGGGGDGFYLLLNNSRIRAQPGEGFLGTAVHVGGPAGNFVEIRNTTIEAANATDLLPASHGLALIPGTRARLVGAVIRGGAGLAGSSHEAGGSAVVAGIGHGDLILRLDGDCDLRGGDAAGSGAGGNGVDISGVLEIGAANVSGGNGSPSGRAYVDAQPVALAYDCHLTLTPHLADAQAPTLLRSGQFVQLSMPTPPGSTVIVVSVDLNLPAGPFLPVGFGGPTYWVLGNQLRVQVPAGPGVWIPGIEMVAQGLAHPPGQPFLLSNTVACRLDMEP